MLAAPQEAGVTSGEVAEVTAAQAVVVEAGGARWHVPRARLPATLMIGDQVTLCALAGSPPERQELARALLNELLRDATA